MLKAVAIILGNGFELALVLSVLVVWLRHTGNMHLSKWVFGGAGFAAIVSFSVLYALKLSGPKRESFTGWAMGIGFIVEILFLIWVIRKLGQRPAENTNRKFYFNRGMADKGFIFLTAASLAVLPLMHVFLFPSSIFIQTYSVVNTELILKFAGGLLGAVMCFIFGLSFLRSTRALTVRSAAFGSIVLMAALMLNQLFTVVQILFAKGVFPLTPLAMKILIPLINNMDKYLYVLLGTTLLWTGMVLWSFARRKAKPSGDWNPAVLRKFKAGERSKKRWLASIAGLMVVIPALLGVEAVLAGRTVELSPAKPVTPDANHQVVIPQTDVDDHHLHRFGFTAADGTLVRFIIIRKSDAAYGIGFDACKICGSSGYYEKNGKVICRKCDVIMNIPTIGFEGGCNPIPLPYQLKQGNLVIAAGDLEKETATFQQESLFKN